VASVRYTYDEVGNRTSEVSERGTTQYTYDEANELKRKAFYANRPMPAVGNPSHPHYMDETTYQYDQNGNRISETENKAGESKQLVTTRYDYDTLNQLTGIQYPEGRKASCAYDPLGRLIESNRPHLPGERPVQAETSRFSYAGHSVIAEWDQAGSPMAEFYHGNGELVAKRLFGRQRDFNRYGVINPHENYLYFQHDALGSVTGLSDSTGAAVMRYRQDAFGTPLAGILEPHNQQLLTEKRFDTQSGLYYFGSRWYDPGSGRFMNQDSYRGALAEPMSLHRYAYVHNNPINMVDEWGYSAQWKPQPKNGFFDWLSSQKIFNAPIGQLGGIGSIGLMGRGTSSEDGESSEGSAVTWEHPSEVVMIDASGAHLIKNDTPSGSKAIEDANLIIHNPVPPALSRMPRAELPPATGKSEFGPEDLLATETISPFAHGLIDNFNELYPDYRPGFLLGGLYDFSYNTTFENPEAVNNAIFAGIFIGSLGELAPGSFPGFRPVIPGGGKAPGRPSVAIENPKPLQPQEKPLLPNSKVEVAPEAEAAGTTVGTTKTSGSKDISIGSKDPYKRPSGYRKGVRDEVWERAKGPDGLVRDPLTGKVMSKDQPWDMGHKPGHEFWKHQQSARERGISREEFLNEYNNPENYRPEIPSSNRGHAGEDKSDTFLGP
jgi:RHS repeat-associated protein